MDIILNEEDLTEIIKGHIKSIVKNIEVSEVTSHSYPTNHWKVTMVEEKPELPF